MRPSLLADLILVFHTAYAGLVALGFVAIPLGASFGWGWVRRRWLRIVHLAMIGFVGLEGLIGMACPLTEWEYGLRQTAGQAAQPGTFIGRILSALLYYDLPPRVFTIAYVVLTALAAGLWWWFPPRRET
jgi:hypothetical protein